MERQQTVDNWHCLVEKHWSLFARQLSRLSMRFNKGPTSSSWGAAGLSRNVAELDHKSGLGILCIGQTTEVTFL